MRLTEAHIEAARKRIPLTEEQINEAVTLYNEHGWSYPRLAKKYNRCVSALHERMAGRVVTERFYNPGKRLIRRTIRGNDEPELNIPESVRQQWLERAKAYASRTDLTAWLMGDPIPGWSALERR